MLLLTLRNLAARKVRLLMSALAIVLGVGFLTGVMVFSHALSTTFDGIVKGSTPAAAVRPVGDEQFGRRGGDGTTQTLGANVVTKLAALPQVAQAEGRITGYGTFLLSKDRKLVTTGPPTVTFNYSSVPSILGQPTLVLRSGVIPTQPGEIALDVKAAAKGGYHLGDTVHLVAPTKTGSLDQKLVGLMDFNGGGTAGATLVVFSTPGAQDLYLNGKDAFTAVSLAGTPGTTEQQVVDAAKSVLPKDFTAVTGDTLIKESKDRIGQFLDVISTFLLVFAIIAIVVGAFIIANTFSILVAQRTRELALLRALGASRRQVTRSVLVEALVMSVLAATLGVGLGLALARALSTLFGSFGLDIASSQLTLTALTVGSAYVVGVLVTLVSAYLPARRAARIPPVAAMRDDIVTVEKSLRLRTWLGVLALVIGAVLAAIGWSEGVGSGSVWIGIASFVWVLTVAVISPVLGRPVLVAVRWLFARVFGTTGRLAGENALRNPRRTGATASALMIGLTIVSAIGVLAASLNKTMDQIVDDQFTADYLVQGVSQNGFPVGIGDQMAKVPGVATVSRQQFFGVLLNSKITFASAVDPDFLRVYHLDLIRGSATLDDTHVMISQSQSSDNGEDVGSKLMMRFPGNKQLTATVSGVYADSPITGAITAPVSLVAKTGYKRTDSVLSILTTPGADKAAVKKQLDAIVKPLPVVTVQDKQEFAAAVKGQVNQLLYIIYGLLALAIVIAVLGIVNTLGLSVLERTREIGLLRAVGLSRSRARRMITLESVSISLLGAALGLGLGVLVGVLLRRTLGNDITALAIPFGQLLLFVALSVVVGVLAAVVPAIRAARMRVLDAIAHVE